MKTTKAQYAVGAAAAGGAEERVAEFGARAEDREGRVARQAGVAPKRRRKQAGVTLIEMLVVVTIIGLFVALVAPNMFKRADQARITQARAQMQNFMTALGAYKLDTGLFPTTEQGLAALRQKPGEVLQWNGPYLQIDVPKDPWGHDFVYKFPGEHGEDPEITCLGADGQPGGEGLNADIVSWKSR